MKPSAKVVLHHVVGPTCPACEAKLALAAPELVSWYRRRKLAHPDLHISWSFRDQQEQTEELASGRTKLPWPTSKHNKQPAQALDIFQLASNGMAVWSFGYFRQLWQETAADPFTTSIRWGGNFKTGEPGDDDHFEVTN